jgi:hypothetical protein
MVKTRIIEWPHLRLYSWHFRWRIELWFFKLLIWDILTACRSTHKRADLMPSEQHKSDNWGWLAIGLCWRNPKSNSILESRLTMARFRLDCLLALIGLESQKSSKIAPKGNHQQIEYGKIFKESIPKWSINKNIMYNIPLRCSSVHKKKSIFSSPFVACAKH